MQTQFLSSHHFNPSLHLAPRGIGRSAKRAVKTRMALHENDRYRSRSRSRCSGVEGEDSSGRIQHDYRADRTLEEYAF